MQILKKDGRPHASKTSAWAERASQASWECYER